MYFVGVTTGQSSIHKLFPFIAGAAGVAGAELAGIDIPPNGAPERYVAAMRQIRDDDACQGALVTTHKVHLVQHAREWFDEFDADARLLGEVSCIVKRGARITGMALDPVSSLLAYQDLGSPSGDVLIFGAGGAGTALAVALRRQDPLRRIVLTDPSLERLAHVKELADAEVHSSAGNNEILSRMPAGSFLVNATGMGKDVPGSPVSGSARWPAQAIAWDFNYRGDLAFLQYAAAAGASIHNGADYFLHGWTRIMARVYDFPVTPALMQQVRLAYAAQA